MAAKKGAQLQFQIDINNEDEWTQLLEKQGLVVVDVYSEWCGPCVACVSSLKKLKLEIGSDYLHFAVAKANAINCLKRFENKCEPTWMFIAGGQLVNLLFGVNAPLLLKTIRQELENEMKVLNEGGDRKWIQFSELTEPEIQRATVLAKKQEERLQKENEKLALKKSQIRERSLKRLSNMISTHSCILYFPHMVNSDGSCPVAQKMMYLNDSISAVVLDQILIQLNKTTIDLVFYKCPVYENFNKATKESLISSKRVMVTLLQIVPREEVFEENMSPRIQKLSTIESLPVEKRLSKIIYGEENAINFTEESVAYEFIVENENGDKLPPMWTPTNEISKSSAIEVFFPRKIETIGYVPDKLPPSQLIIIYDANKVSDVMDLVNTYKEEVYRIGFFDSINPQQAKLICKNYETFTTLVDEQIKNVKMVISLTGNNTEELLLEFSQVIPLYISPNEKIGTDESDQFFPYDYEDDCEESASSNTKRDITQTENENIIRSDIILDL